MKKTILSILLAVCLLLSLAPAACAAGWTEAGSARELAQLLAADAAETDAAVPLSAEEPARVLLFADALPDRCGARRVLHYAAYREFVLEFDAAEAAEAAYGALTGRYGLTDCWLDTADLAAQPLTVPEPAACRSWGAAEMGLDTLKARAAEELPAGRTATVAVIDTGADLTHPQFAGRAVSSASYDFVAGSMDITDTNGHGTTVAGLLADLTPDHVELMLLRVFNDEGKASRTMVLTALQYAVEQGVDVINMSLGWPNATAADTFLNAAIEAAYAAGIPIVCAAGNNRSDAQRTYPANHSRTVAVSALYENMRFAETWPGGAGSCYGAAVDFCAPGTAVVTAAAGGGTKTSSGTSLAAPHITACLADILLAEPDLSPEQAYGVLRTYARDLGTAGKDGFYGWGCPVMGDYFHDISCPGLAFGDMPGKDSWAHAGLDYCLKNGLLTGFPGGVLAPNDGTTRAQITMMLWRAAGSPAPAGAAPFADVAAGAWYAPAVAWAYETGVVRGVSAAAFAPNAPVSRQDLTLLLFRLVPDAPLSGALDAFPDAADVADYAGDAMAWAVGAGVIQGDRVGGVDYLRPRAGATRAQIAAILMRFDGAA